MYKRQLLGDAWGVSNLGWCMEAGVGVEASPEEAVWLYRQAVEMGFTPALCNLGVCLQRGLGCRPDPEAAAACYQQAAERGYARGQRLLAGCYKNGTEMCIRDRLVPHALPPFCPV